MAAAWILNPGDGLARRPRSIWLFAAALLAAATLGSCGEPPRPGLEKVVVKGKTFWVEPALDEPTRIKGLGGRASIPEDGGMLFVFTFATVQQFVMRDCTFDIDIAFLDNAGRVVAFHTMLMDPRKPGESDNDYEMRLKRYSSKFAARMALEVRGGTFATLGLKEGDILELDVEGLKRRAK